jgi:hypothetical protein
MPCVSFKVPCCCVSVPKRPADHLEGDETVRNTQLPGNRTDAPPEEVLSPSRNSLRFPFSPSERRKHQGIRRGVLGELPPCFDDRPHRVQLVLSVDNMNASVSGRESLNGAAEPGRDLLEIDVFDGAKSVRAKHRCNASRLETADRTFINFLKLFGPLRL